MIPHETETEPAAPVGAFGSAYARAILGALQRPGMHVYTGTVPPEVRARRRKANRVARHSRQINRKKAA